MNRTDDLELRGVNPEDEFIAASSYGSGNYGSGSNGSGNSANGDYTVLLRESNLQVRSEYEYYEINCPSDTRLLQVSIVENHGSYSPSLTVRTDAYNVVGEVSPNSPANVRVRASGTKLFRLYRSFNTYATVKIACYTCPCAL